MAATGFLKSWATTPSTSSRSRVACTRRLVEAPVFDGERRALRERRGQPKIVRLVHARGIARDEDEDPEELAANEKRQPQNRSGIDGAENRAGAPRSARTTRAPPASSVRRGTAVGSPAPGSARWGRRRSSGSCSSWAASGAWLARALTTLSRAADGCRSPRGRRCTSRRNREPSAAPGSTASARSRATRPAPPRPRPGTAAPPRRAFAR